jgi:hypothetical protein
MIYAILSVIFLAALLWQDRTHRQALEAALRTAREERSNLIAQIQANTQNRPFYPQVGPAPDPVPEQRWLSDSSGLIQFEDYAEDAFAELAR